MNVKEIKNPIEDIIKEAASQINMYLEAYAEDLRANSRTSYDSGNRFEGEKRDIYERSDIRIVKIKNFKETDEGMIINNIYNMDPFRILCDIYKNHGPGFYSVVFDLHKRPLVINIRKIIEICDDYKNPNIGYRRDVEV